MAARKVDTTHNLKYTKYLHCFNNLLAYFNELLFLLQPTVFRRNFSADTTVEQIFICLTIFIAYFQALVDTNFSQEQKKIQKALKSFRETFALRDSAKQGPSHSAYIF